MENCYEYANDSSRISTVFLMLVWLTFAPLPLSLEESPLYMIIFIRHTSGKQDIRKKNTK